MKFKKEFFVAENTHDYLSVEQRWTNLHIITQAILSGMAVFLEIVMFFVLTASGRIETTPEVYVLKYVLIPTMCNLVLILGSLFFVYRTGLPPFGKRLAVSCLFALSAFVITSVHGLFSSIYSVFFLPLVMTTVYGSFAIINSVAAFSLVLQLVSVFFIYWDGGKIVDGSYVTNVVVIICLELCVYVACVMIITQERRKHKAAFSIELERSRLQDALFCDDLCGVNNKLAFLERMRQLDGQYEKNVFLVMFDIDNFKKVNDTYGHLKGDEMLIAFGGLLKLHCENGTPYRFGGDEFCILYEGVPLYKAVDNVKLIHRSFGETFSDSECRAVNVSLSAGVAPYHSGMSPERLVENADDALYKSKQNGKNRVSIYSREEQYVNI